MKLISDYLKIKTCTPENKTQSTGINFGPKKVVKCNTCMFVYDRTKKKESKTHKAFHKEYLSN